MRNVLKCILLAVLLVGAGGAARAFSLIGPFATYQLPELNYNGPFTTIAVENDIGGPMNIGEEYRWGSPVVVYGFDSAFVEYFGTNGVAAVEAAIQILNNLPTTSAMSAGLTEFPLNATRFNYTAQQLRLRDIKSISLSILLQTLGLACPERYTWTIFQQRPIPNTDPQQYYYNIIQRNFDPVTFQPSAYVNGTLYTYQILQVSANPDTWDCQELAVDVANPNVSVVATAGLQAAAVDPRVYSQVYGPANLVADGFGLFYTGITRDDAGAIRYIYRPENINWQAAPLNSFGSSSGSFGGGDGSPWYNISFQIVVPDPISPWTVVGGPIGGTVTNGVTASSFVPVGGRSGAGKLSYVRIDTDPLLGQFLVPVSVSYPETVITTNGIAVRQVIERTILQPDILFTAADLGGDGNLGQPYVYAIAGNNFVTEANPGVGSVQDGPGIVDIGIQIVLNKVGPWIFNVQNGNQLSGTRGFVWGSYDGTTNAPLVYPVGSGLQELESRLFP